MGTLTGREVASRKSVTRFLRIMSEWIGRNSGLEEDNEDLLLEECEILEKEDANDWLDSLKDSKKSHMLVFPQALLDCLLCPKGLYLYHGN